MTEMKVMIDDRSPALRARLKERLEVVATLRCVEHGTKVVAVTIHGRENGWFDSRWVTCCSRLEEQASAIVKERI